MTIRPFQADDMAALMALWQAAGLVRPVNDPVRDVERKLAADPDGLLVTIDDVDRALVGSVMVGDDGHLGWVNYLGVHPDHRRAGIGRTLMAAAEARMAALGGPKVNLRVRTDNDDAVAFYRQLGHAADPVVSLGRRLIHDDGTR